MVGQERGIRLRAALDGYFVPVVLGFVLLAAAGGYLAFTAYAEPNTATETRETATWESAAEFTHSATVVNGTDVYEQGERLENRTSYFRRITPRLNGTYLYTYTASEGGDLRANASVVLVYRSATETDEGNVTEYWRLERELGSREASLSPGDRLRVPFSRNVSAAAARLDEIDEQLGGTPGQKELIVEARLSLSGTRNGQPVEGARTHRLPISLSDNVYQPQDPGPITDSGGQTEQVTVTVDPGPVSTYGGPLLLLVGLVGAGGLSAARYGDYLAVSERERDWLAYRNAREEFDDWITAARVPEEARPAPTVEVDTLEGLVDVAIDTDRRVLEDGDRGEFVVLEADRTYTYSPPSLLDGGGLLPPGGADGSESEPTREGTEEGSD